MDNFQVIHDHRQLSKVGLEDIKRIRSYLNELNSSRHADIQTRLLAFKK
jgi:hypothetical protein